MKKKGLPFRIVGYFFLIPGVLIFFLGIAMVATYSNAQELSAGKGLALFSIGIIIPGLLFVIKGFSIAQREEQLELIVTALLTNRRITVESLAEKVGLHESLTRRLLYKGVAGKKLKGFFDRNTGEFVLEESLEQSQRLDKCPSCGAPLDKLYLKGEQVVCPACNTIISS